MKLADYIKYVACSNAAGAINNASDNFVHEPVIFPQFKTEKDFLTCKDTVLPKDRGDANLFSLFKKCDFQLPISRALSHHLCGHIGEQRPLQPLIRARS